MQKKFFTRRCKRINRISVSQDVVRVLFNGEKMETYMEILTYRVPVWGSGVIVGRLLLPFISLWISEWVKQIHGLLEGVLPGRKVRKLSRGNELLTERVEKIESDIDNIRKLLIERLDSDKKEAATPSKNGIATPQ
ncbi:hypothetical protein H6F88_30685 [Oculatella sp. FACHB-28]|uniref:hypothetical protein n=1 Tax=Oculatella sp. FACHB-28 TaxID=2692845 RepID=UPI00168254BA|nr:hypothetical protein [Oculatella sp. FACHB-28]MBD2060313.1 hypothetical protein [Oculatella sp. FACHB-28]